MIYERIEKALNSAIKLHNSGVSANESIVKVARENELNPETISRVIEAFNTAKTKAYVKVAKDKAADFDVADKKTVIASVFSDQHQVKHSSVVAEMVDDIEDFSVTEDGNEKTAEEYFAPVVTSKLPLDARIKMAFLAIKEQDRLLQEQKELLIDSRESFYKGIKNASDLLSFNHEREKIADYAAQIFYQYDGDKCAGGVLSLISKIANIETSDLFDKLAGDVDYTESQFTQFFDEAVEALDSYSKNVKDFNNSVKDCSEKEAELRGLIFSAGGVEKNDSASNYLWSPGRGVILASEKFAQFPVDLLLDFETSLFCKPQKQEISKKNAADMLSPLTAVTNQLQDNIKNKITSSDQSMQGTADKGYLLRSRGIDSPRAEMADKQEVENIKRESILRELMADEIISQQNPSDVESSYNSLIQLAPNASLIKDIARSVLRQGTAQVIDPHFANSLVELEHNLLKTKNFSASTPQSK